MLFQGSLLFPKCTVYEPSKSFGHALNRLDGLVCLDISNVQGEKLVLELIHVHLLERNTKKVFSNYRRKY